MQSRSLLGSLPATRGESTPRTRAVSRGMLALASAAGLSLIGVAVVSPEALSAGMPVALLFYPLLWAAAIAAYRRS